jgi:hypothetical protein
MPAVSASPPNCSNSSQPASCPMAMSMIRALRKVKRLQGRDDDTGTVAARSLQAQTPRRASPESAAVSPH